MRKRGSISTKKDMVGLLGEESRMEWGKLCQVHVGAGETENS